MLRATACGCATVTVGRGRLVRSGSGQLRSAQVTWSICLVGFRVRIVSWSSRRETEGAAKRCANEVWCRDKCRNA
ncbi:hypothetical protein LX32DRAFT_324437 [Colletotrichum zoysiae]|uniref:Uncharacterized protein n=1 Tax=Colletotrichum zoysiae TaxID=1216348 RepID=A0AAD9HLE2_9PEZI|nr:hypothetical protein LX32DRAFT_324437 [Colletotrichum zoysiae]